MRSRRKFFRSTAKLLDGHVFEGVGWTQKEAENAAFAMVEKRRKEKAPERTAIDFTTVQSIGPKPRTLED